MNKIYVENKHKRKGVNLKLEGKLCIYIMQMDGAPN